MTNKEFRHLREVAGISQVRIAVRSGIDRTRLSMWENGDMQLSAKEVDKMRVELVGCICESLAALEKVAKELQLVK